MICAPLNGIDWEFGWLTMICNEPHAENLNNQRMCSEMDLFRATVFFSWIAHIRPVFSRSHRICVSKLLFSFSSFVFISKRWRAFILSEIYLKTVLKRGDHATQTQSLAHLFYVSYSKNIHKLRSSIPSGRTGQLSYIYISFFVTIFAICCAHFSAIHLIYLFPIDTDASVVFLFCLKSLDFNTNSN